MKNKYYLIIIILISVLLYLVIVRDNDYNIMVIATSYSDDITSVNYYKNENLIKTDNYDIGGVEELFKNDAYIMFNKYSNKLLITKDETIKYEIKYNPLQMYNYNKLNYILHNESINSFSLTIYDDNYKVIKNSNAFKGYARNFIFRNNIVYILANIYDNNLDREVVLYSLDPKSLEIINITVIDNMTFAFYMNFLDDNIYIYMVMN